MKNIKKLWIVLAFLLLLCGCSAKSQNAAPVSAPVETEQKQTESADVHEAQENSEKEEQDEFPAETDMQDDAHIEEPQTTEEPKNQEEPAGSPEQEPDTEPQEEETKPLSEKPKLADFPYATVPDDVFLDELAESEVYSDDTPVQWHIYTQMEAIEHGAVGNSENAFAPVKLTEGISIYDLPDTLKESSVPYRNDTVEERIGAYQTQIVVSGEFDLDGCGEYETIQLLYLRGSSGSATGARIIKNDTIFNLEVDPEPYGFIEDLWLADLDADGSVELYLHMRNGSVWKELFAWEFSASGLQRLQFDGEESLSSAVINMKDDIMFAVAYTRLSGAHVGLRRYGKSGQQIVPIDTEWTYAFLDDDSIFGEFAVLMVKESIPAVLADGTQTLLLPDTYLIITSGDEKSYMRFLTEDGLRGMIPFTEVSEYQMAYINGKWIDAYFDFYPRAN